MRRYERPSKGGKQKNPGEIKIAKYIANRLFIKQIDK